MHIETFSITWKTCVFENQKTTGPAQNCDKGKLCQQCLPHCPKGLLFKHLAGSKVLWASYPCISFHNHFILFPPSAKNLSALNLLSSALCSESKWCNKATCWWVKMALHFGVTYIRFIEHFDDFSSEIGDISHKGGRDSPCFWFLMWFWSLSSYCCIHIYMDRTVISILAQKEEKR